MPCPYVFSERLRRVMIERHYGPLYLSKSQGSATTSSDPTVSFYRRGKFVNRQLEHLLNLQRGRTWIWIPR